MANMQSDHSKKYGILTWKEDPKQSNQNKCVTVWLREEVITYGIEKHAKQSNQKQMYIRL